MTHLAQWEQYFAEEFIAAKPIAMPDAQPQHSAIKVNQLERAKCELFIEFRIETTLVDGGFALARLAFVRQQVELHVTVVVVGGGGVVVGSYEI